MTGMEDNGSDTCKERETVQRTTFLRAAPKEDTGAYNSLKQITNAHNQTLWYKMKNTHTKREVL